MENTEAQVYCMVRCSSEAEGMERISGKLQEKGIWKDIYLPRISVVIGDLSLPELGISQETQDYLSEAIDVIFHLGASVKWISSYESEAQANVLSFIEILKLAARGKTKAIHYTSSMSTYVSGKKTSITETIFEDTVYEEPGTLLGGYCQTKWVCERIIEEARKRNVPINMYRIGEVIGDSQTGMLDHNNFVNLFMCFCILSKMAPARYFNARFDFMAVDYQVKAMLHIAGNIEGNGQNFQFTSPQIFTLGEMVDEMNRCGFEVRLVSDEEWEQAVNDKSEYAKKVKTIFRKLSIDQYAKEFTLFDIGQSVFLRIHDTSNTDRVMSGSKIHCKRMIADGVLKKYFAYIMEHVANEVH